MWRGPVAHEHGLSRGTTGAFSGPTGRRGSAGRSLYPLSPRMEMDPSKAMHVVARRVVTVLPLKKHSLYLQIVAVVKLFLFTCKEATSPIVLVEYESSRTFVLSRPNGSLL
jgi:hypothetical protein